MNKQLLNDYYNNQCNESEKTEVEKWLATHEHTLEIDEYLCNLLNRTSIIHNVQKVEQAYETFENKRKILAKHSLKSRLISASHWIQRIAAIIIIPILLATYYYYEKASSPIIWQEAYAPLGETRLIRLPDNSKIWINAGSKLIYPKEFTHPFRQVYVVGEAYAEVQKDATHPFIMTANNVNIQVTGTKFNVRSYIEESEIEVFLIDGGVSMSTIFNGQERKRTLSPGDVIRFDRKNGNFSKYTIDVGSYSPWFNGPNFYFIDQTLEQIVASLKRHFKVDIVIENEWIKQCKYYAVFINNESIEQILSALSTQQNIKITAKNNVIYISE